jgi:molybdopterin/thiamine biosynthesis adenylyltransferase
LQQLDHPAILSRNFYFENTTVDTKKHLVAASLETQKLQKQMNESTEVQTLKATKLSIVALVFESIHVVWKATLICDLPSQLGFISHLTMQEANPATN